MDQSREQDWGPGEMMALCEETVFYLAMSEEKESIKKTNKQTTIEYLLLFNTVLDILA